MHKKESKNKECEDKTVKDKKNKKGFHEEKNVLSGKSPQHSLAALKKDANAISNEGVFVPTGKKDETADFEMKDDFETPDKNKEQIGETVTLRFEDSEKFINAVSEFDNDLPLDFDDNSFIVEVSKEKVDAFREFMSEKGIEEMPNANETEKKIAEVQNKRSNRALELDNSKKAIKIGSSLDDEFLSKWLRNPQLSDIIGVDDGKK